MNTHPLRRLADTALDLVLPNRCVGCGDVIGADGALCAGCFRALEFVAEPCCATCGITFAYEMAGPATGGLADDDAAVCGACAARPPAFHAARAALVYNDLARKLVVGFKHADQTHLVAALAGWVEQAASTLIGRADVLVPVPLHRRRLFARRFNQSALLAARLSRSTAVPWLPDVLVRVRATPSQGHLNAVQRRRNVRRAFQVRAARREAIAGAHVLLIDDVLTTGATLDACAETLLAAGAARVEAATVARVILAD